MNSCPRRYRATFLLATCLLGATPSPSPATIVFDDHFDGGSGGVPAGWFQAMGTGTVIEWGTVVDLLYSKVVIGSDAEVDPSAGEVTMNLWIAGVGGAAQGGAGFYCSSLSSRFGAMLRVVDGRIYVVAADGSGGEQNYVAGYLSGYTGAPLCLTLELGTTGFRIVTDLPPFDSGFIPYGVAFPTFTRAALGAAAKLFLVNDVEPGQTGSSSFDRIVISVDEPTPVRKASFGRIRTLFRP